MAELRLTFDVEGERQIDRKLSRFGENITDLRPFWGDIFDDLRTIGRQQFQSEGSRSRAWAPLSPGYAAWKASHGGGRILELTGRLRASLAEETADSITERDKLSMRYGTRVPWAGFHQTGTRRMPRRRPIDINEGDRRRWMKRLQRFAVDQAKAAGRLG